MSIISEQIHLDSPNVGSVEKDYLCRAVDSGFVSTAGPFVPEFEAKMAAFLGVSDSVAVQSGTAALHLALTELGIGKGDEVILPALTFAATANAVVHAGATPVIADVDPATWTMTASNVRPLVNKRTRAIIPVHLFGVPCNMAELLDLARQQGLAVIEDAAESLGATYAGRHTGTLGDFGCFSFNGNKTMTTGGGGLLTGHSTDRLFHIRFLANQARDAERGYYHPEIGFNYRMTNIEAALGLAQLTRLDEFLLHKSCLHATYREELAEIPAIVFQEAPEGGTSSHWLTCVSFPNEQTRTAMANRLKEVGIPTRPLFMPLGNFPPFRENAPQPCPIAEDLFARSLCLPSSTLNSVRGIAAVCGYIREVLA